MQRARGSSPSLVRSMGVRREHLGRHSVPAGDFHRIATAEQHATLPILRVVLRVGRGVLVAIAADQPDKSSSVARVAQFSRLIVAHEGDRIGQHLSGLVLGPGDDLKNVSTGDVIGVRPPVGRVRAAAMEVDPEPRILVFPAGITLIDLLDLDLAHKR